MNAIERLRNELVGCTEPVQQRLLMQRIRQYERTYAARAEHKWDKLAHKLRSLAAELNLYARHLENGK